MKKISQIRKKPNPLFDFSHQFSSSISLDSSKKNLLFLTQGLLGFAILQDNKFRYVNKRFADLCGYSQKTMLNWKEWKFLKVIHPENKEFVIRQAQLKQNGGTNIVPSYTFRLLRKNGRIIWVRIFSETILFDGKLADFITLIGFNKADKTRSVGKCSDLGSNYEKIQTILDKIILHLVHGVNTPLNAILPTCEMLLKYHKTKLKPEVSDSLKTIIKGSEKLKIIFDNIFTFYYLDFRNYSLNYDLIDILHFSEEIIEKQQIFFGGKSLNIKLLNEGIDPIYIECDPPLIKRVILNLIHYCLENPTKDEQILEIRITNLRNKIKLSFISECQFLDKKEINNLLKNSDKTKAEMYENLEYWSNFGLYIVKRIIEMHKGKIYLSPSLNKRRDRISFILPKTI